MSPRVAIFAALLVLVIACKKGVVPPAPDAAAAATSSAFPPASGPCTKDVECAVYLDSCDCSCHPMLVSAPAPRDEAWGKMCGSAGPRNCGAASPCMNLNPTCDTTVKKCALAKRL